MVNEELKEKISGGNRIAEIKIVLIFFFKGNSLAKKRTFRKKDFTTSAALLLLIYILTIYADKQTPAAFFVLISRTTVRSQRVRFSCDI